MPWRNKAGPAHVAVQSLPDAMAHHHAAEESGLFPAFETRTQNSVSATQVMRSKHEQYANCCTR
jgi:hemerythrin-like domain-containing protein